MKDTRQMRKAKHARGQSVSAAGGVGRPLGFFPAILLLLISAMLLPWTANAQVKSSAITGTVTDPNGAVVAKAKVTAIEQATNVKTSVETNATGVYIIPYLPTGTYSVTVEAKGFKLSRTDGISLATQTTLRLDPKLALGDTHEVVVVSATAQELQTESAAIGNAVETQVIANIPNINSNPLYYATLQAGVVPTSAMYNYEAVGVGYSDRQSISGIRINGGTVGNNDVQIDGLSVQGAAWHEATVLPNRDALQEVRVSTNDFSAETGGGQGVISMTTKSGTNKFHGDADYRIRNEQLNANSFSNKMQSPIIPRGKYRINEASGSVGGPIILPHLYNGKDRLFFFVSFSRVWTSQPVQGFHTVPTALERQGDFGSTLIKDNNGNPVPAHVFDPYSITYVPGTNNQVVQRREFPRSTNCDAAYGCGDKVDTPDTYGLAVLAGYPSPNRPGGTDQFHNNNFFYNGSAAEYRNNLNARVDFHLSQNQSIYASGGWDKGALTPINTWGSGSRFINYGGGSNILDDNPFASIGDTVILSPTLVLDARIGVQRIHSTNSYPNGNFTSADYSKYGMPTGIQSLIAVPGTAPSIGDWRAGWGADGLNLDYWNRKNEHQTNWSANGSVTKTLGKWTLKEGAEYRVDLGNWEDLQYGTPSLFAGWGSMRSYTEQYANLDGTTNGLNTTPQQGGIMGAALAVGAQGYSVDSGSTTQPALAAKYLAFYSQNDWKVNHRLTLNLGLRYEIQPGPTERHNHVTSIDMRASNPYGGGYQPAAGTSPAPDATMGKIAFAGADGYSRNMWDTDWSNIAPRLGFAYLLNSKTVIRGGIGRTFTPSNSGFNANGLVYGGLPWNTGTATTPYGRSPNGKPVGHFEDIGNTAVFVAPGAQDPSIYGNPSSNSGVDFLLRNGYKNGRVDQWNIVVERKIYGWIANVGYVASKARYLTQRGLPLNGKQDVPWSTYMEWQNTWIQSNGAIDPAQQQVPNPLPALAGKAHGDIGHTTITQQESMFNHLGLLGQSVTASLGKSLYNSLQVNLQHQSANGLTVLIGYTYSRTSGNTGGQQGSQYAESQVGGGNTQPQGASFDWRNPKNNWGLEGYDTPQRLVATVSYDLPFGKGKHWDPGNLIGRELIGGWNLAAVVTAESGEPWSPQCNDAENTRCIPTGQPLVLPKSYQKWYDGKTSVTLPDGRTFTPGYNTYLKWNPDAFTEPTVRFPDGTVHAAQYWLGTTPMAMSQLRMPGFQNVNLSLNKAFPITEGINLQLLAEATNAFNKTNFKPNAVNYGFNVITIPDASAHSAVGQNANSGYGTLSPNFYDPRQITLSLRLNF